MVVCSYYAAGYCRHGSNCRREHVMAGRSQTREYAFSAEGVQKDLTKGAERPEWVLSVYGPAKFEPSYITGIDISQEEMRVRAYEAQTQNRLKEYKSFEAAQQQRAENIVADRLKEPMLTFKHITEQGFIGPNGLNGAKVPATSSNASSSSRVASLSDDEFITFLLTGLLPSTVKPLADKDSEEPERKERLPDKEEPTQINLGSFASHSCSGNSDALSSSFSPMSLGTAQLQSQATTPGIQKVFASATTSKFSQSAVPMSTTTTLFPGPMIPSGPSPIRTPMQEEKPTSAAPATTFKFPQSAVPLSTTTTLFPGPMTPSGPGPVRTPVEEKPIGPVNNQEEVEEEDTTEDGEGVEEQEPEQEPFIVSTPQSTDGEGEGSWTDEGEEPSAETDSSYVFAAAPEARSPSADVTTTPHANRRPSPADSTTSVNSLFRTNLPSLPRPTQSLKMAPLPGAAEVPLGAIVEIPVGKGVVRYNGATKFAPGRWIGVELSESKGKNDGSINGEVYFSCKMKYGLFVRRLLITSIALPSNLGASTSHSNTTMPSGSVMSEPTPYAPNPSKALVSNHMPGNSTVSTHSTTPEPAGMRNRAIPINDIVLEEPNPIDVTGHFADLFVGVYRNTVRAALKRLCIGRHPSEHDRREIGVNIPFVIH